LATVAVATGIGTEELAGWQIVFTIFSAAAFALDALAIAAQALIGKELGAGDERQVHRVLRRTVAWGVWFGVVVGALIAALSGVLGIVFTGDPSTAALVQPALLILAVAQPIAGVVFVLDGVLIGAGDTRWLAWAQLALLVAYVPVVLVVRHVAGPLDDPAAVAWLWVGFSIFMTLRGIALGLRARSDAWLVTGATR